MSASPAWQYYGFAFLTERTFTRASVGGLEQKDIPDSFLSFLALAQKLGLAILPITWQSARQEIGRGGTSKINEALANVRMSFAFKRIADGEKSEDSKAENFRILSNEVTILSQRWIREHPNIVQLQGICWDVENDDNIWPVLVFEKSKFGDLYNFSRSKIGCEMDTQGRLRLCCEIGKAITDMHSQRLIHGDIKPHNVLIFPNDGEDYSAKVMDFGYSTRQADEKHLVLMPISGLWTAPEHTRQNRRWTQVEAKRMDAFSLGILCLWFLFERSLSEIPMTMADSEIKRTTVAPYTGFDKSITILENYKIERQLRSLAQELLKSDSSLSEIQKRSLSDFFTSVLSDDQSERDINAWNLFHERIGPNHQALLIANEEDELRFSGFSFQIENSILELYICDYRIRSYIFNCLEEKLYQCSESSPETDGRSIAFQVALCYSLGFGVEKDDQKSMEILQSSSHNDVDLERTLAHFDQIQDTSYYTSRLRDLKAIGHMPSIEIDSYYLEKGKLEEAELRLAQESKDLEASLGDGNIITLTAKQALCSVFVLGKRWEYAENLQIQILQATMSRGTSPGHPLLLTTVNNLAMIFHNLGEWQKAERLHLKVMERSREALDIGHVSSITNMNNLAVTYRHQGQLDKAAHLQRQTLQMNMDLFGLEHPSTLFSMAELAHTYRKQWRWEDVEMLQTRVLATNERVLGIDHPDTLKARMNVAGSLYILQRYEEAEKFAVPAMQSLRMVLGEGHPDTLNSMEVAANIYWRLDRQEEAVGLMEKTVKLREEFDGAAHPFTNGSRRSLEEMEGNRRTY